MNKLVAIALALTFTGAGLTALAQPQPPTAPSESDPVAWEAGQKAYLDWNKAQKGWTVSKTGIQTRRTSAAGKGASHPKATDQVTINYEGRLIDGKVFDSSARSARGPSTLPLPALIKGWQEVIPQMRKGETWEAVIPAAMGYQARNMGAIPPNSTLIFQIELLDFGPSAPN